VRTLRGCAVKLISFLTGKNLNAETRRHPRSNKREESLIAYSDNRSPEHRNFMLVFLRRADDAADGVQGAVPSHVGVGGFVGEQVGEQHEIPVFEDDLICRSWSVNPWTICPRLMSAVLS